MYSKYISNKLKNPQGGTIHVNGINLYVYTPGHQNTIGLTDCQKDEPMERPCKNCPSKNACWTREIIHTKYVKETKPLKKIRGQIIFL